MALPLVIVSYWGVLAAAVFSMILGALWYSPLLFGNMWIKLSGFSKKDVEAAKKKGMQGMNKYYFGAFIGALVTSYVLAHILSLLAVTSVGEAMQAVFWLWLGFIVPVLFSSVLWEGKPFLVYCINVSHYLVSLVLMSTVLMLL